MALPVLLLALQPEQVLNFAEFAKHSSGHFFQFPESGGQPLQLLADISPYSSPRFEWHFSSVPAQYSYWRRNNKLLKRKFYWFVQVKHGLVLTSRVRQAK